MFHHRENAGGRTPATSRFAIVLVAGFLVGCPDSSSRDGAGTQDDQADSSPAGSSYNGGESQSDGNGAATDNLSQLQVFPPDNPWNQDISGLPVHPNSAHYLASMGLENGLHADFGTVWEGAPIGIPYVVVRSDQPKVPVQFDYADESDPGPYPIPPDPPIEGGPNADGDRHILIVDIDHKLLYELYAAYPTVAGWTAGSGAIFDLTSDALRPAGWTSADAAGLPIFPGLVRYDEVVQRGAIAHALRFTVRRTQRAYVSPARHFASDDRDPDRPPMGLRVRLRVDFDLSGFSRNVQVILRALKKYGMFVADNGSDWYVSGAPDPRWDDAELHTLDQVQGHDFEVVYTGEPHTD
jgi:hypothetical protein